MKKRYNETLARMNKAIAYMDNPNAPDSAKDKWQPQFEELESQLDNIIDELRGMGEKPTHDEILEGFKNVG